MHEHYSLVVMYILKIENEMTRNPCSLYEAITHLIIVNSSQPLLWRHPKKACESSFRVHEIVADKPTGVFGLLVLYQLHKVVGIRSTNRESKVHAGISNILELQMGAIWEKSAKAFMMSFGLMEVFDIF